MCNAEGEVSNHFPQHLETGKYNMVAFFMAIIPVFVCLFVLSFALFFREYRCSFGNHTLKCFLI